MPFCSNSGLGHDRQLRQPQRTSGNTPADGTAGPGYNVKLRGCNLRPANTNNTAIVTFRANADYGMTTLVTGDQFRANGGGCYNGNDYYYIGYTQLFGSSIAQYYHYNAST